MKIKARISTTKFVQLILLVAGLVAIGWPAPGLAVGCDSLVDATAGEKQIVAVVELAPAIPEQPSRSRKAYTFDHAHQVVTVVPGNKVVLASTEDGTGWLSTDDRVVLQVAGGVAWKWDYRKPDRMGIVPIPPQDLTEMFKPGLNEVDLSLQDLMGPVFSTQPYYLVIYECGQEGVPPEIPTPVATPTTAPTVTPSPTARPTSTAIPSATPTSTESPTAQPTSTVIPTATQTSTAAPTATSTPVPKRPVSEAVAALVPSTPTPTSTPTITPTSPLTMPPAQTTPRFAEPWTIWVAAVFGVLGFGALLLWRRQRTGTRLVGVLGIYRHHRFVTQINLADRGQTSITIGTQGDIRLSAQNMPTVTARIYAERSEEGETDTYLDLLGPDDGAVQETILLRDGDEINLDDDYSLKYGNPLTQLWTYEGEQYV